MIHSSQIDEKEMNKVRKTLQEHIFMQNKEFTAEKIDCNMILSQIFSGLRDEIDINKELICCLDNLPSIQADADVFRVIMKHLIGNALQHNSNHHIKITVGSSEDKCLKQTIFHVKDNGNGIREKDIHTPFILFRSDDIWETSSIKKQIQSGLGLKLVNEIIQRHNGQIWFESALSEGSSFFFYLGELSYTNFNLNPPKTKTHLKAEARILNIS